jgi:hypothetical protein
LWIERHLASQNSIYQLRRREIAVERSGPVDAIDAGTPNVKALIQEQPESVNSDQAAKAVATGPGSSYDALR